MKPNRSVPVLLIVFGMLIGLIAISGFGALHRARETYPHLLGHWHLLDRLRQSC